MKTRARFKNVLANMEHSEALNFIWLYDQYVQSLEDEEYPVNIEQFYSGLYEQLLFNQQGGTTNG